ncbi:MAG: bifunctional adenosylcobinamide kinase/adenosylcobinamide-phosphate guanylyltransferase [Gammaproteobacteria bacterium]|nr:bifunctional adenosylcobinamide kinase/adenosylcobinamide-phosphate guanylyltransferase [Gammaproteobacteria bacterium]
MTNRSIELILGGARSGKSGFAEQCAKNSGLSVTYIATATSLDDEMARRIKHHQQQRPSHWQLIEEPLALAQVIKTHSTADSCLIIDCLTLWLTNCLFGEHDIDWQTAKANLFDALSQAQGQVLLVSNEVGLGIIPMGEVSRHFVDEAGWLHQELAQQADKVTFVIAGLPQVLKQPTRD